MNTDLIPDAALVRQQLDKLRHSTVLCRSARLFLLLEFLIEETVAGRGSTLKELVVGEALYGRHAPYDPCVDSTVRVEARRLRRKLLEYYEGPGRDAPFRIVLPSGGYRPVFEHNQSPAVDRRTAAGRAEASVDLAIMPFRAVSPSERDIRLADALTDEVIHTLSRVAPIRLAPRLAVFQYRTGSYSLRDAASALGANAMLHGLFRIEDGRFRVSLEISDAAGCLVWSDRLDAPCPHNPFREEVLAETIVARLPDWISRKRTRGGQALSLVS